MTINTKIFIAVCLLISSMHQISAQKVSMRSGFAKSNFYLGEESITKVDMTNLMKKDGTSWKHWKRSNTFNTLSWVALITEAGFATWNIIDKNPENERAANIGVYTSLAGVIVFSLLSHGQRKKAISSYNSKFDQFNVFTIKPSKKGLGIVVQF